MIHGFESERRNSPALRANLLNFLLFLSGALFACIVVKLGGTGAFLASGFSASSSDVFFQALLSFSRFLLLLYLLAYLRCGVLLIPLVFGLEGLLMGGTAAAVAAASGWQGTVLLAIMLMFRLILILPYSFLLGTWAIGQSLRYSELERDETRIPVLLVTLLVLLLAAALECTAARRFSSIYLLTFGV